jgi:uncharacterized tellurite resistance protein B-like protein
MPLRFLKLFRTKNDGSPTDGFTQTEREAILDALHYFIYVDNHLSLAEDKFIQDWANTLDWDKNLSLFSYEEQSITNARRAREDADYRNAFLNSIAARLSTPESRTIALSLLERLAHADGQADSESAFITAFKNLLKSTT